MQDIVITPEERRAQKVVHLKKVQERIIAHARAGKYFPNVKYELTVSSVELSDGDLADALHLLWHGYAKTIPSWLYMDADVVVARDDDGYLVTKHRYNVPGARVAV